MNISSIRYTSISLFPNILKISNASSSSKLTSPFQYPLFSFSRDHLNGIHRRVYSSCLPTLNQAVSSITQNPLISLQAVKESKPEEGDSFRLFIDTNEALAKDTLGALEKEPVTGQTILFVSGFFGLNIASIARKSSVEEIQYLIAVDTSRYVQVFWDHVSKIIIQSNNKEELLKKVHQLVTTRKEELGHIKRVDSLDSLYDSLYDKTSWLSTDERFSRIKRIFDANHFIFNRVNLFDSEAMQSLSNNIKTSNLQLDTVYLSNIREYAERRDCLPAYQKGLEALQACSSKNTILIDTQPRVDFNRRPEPCQRFLKYFKSINAKWLSSPSPHNEEEEYMKFFRIGKMINKGLCF